MKSSTNRIAIYLPSLCGGGAEKIMVNLCAGFIEKGLEVDLVLSKAEGPYLAQVPSQVNVIDLGASRVLFSLPALVKYLRKNKPFALLSALDHSNIVAILARYLAKVPTRVVISIHSTLSEKINKQHPVRTKAFLYLLARIYPAASGIVAVSRGVAEDFSQITGLPRDTIQVIYNPVITTDIYRRAAEPLDHPWFAPDEVPVIITVGRMTKLKDHSTLIRAFARAREKKPLRLLILGEGELRPELKALIHELGLDDDVALPGFVDNPYKYMSKAAGFVLSSRCEGLPTVLIEALATGIPIVSTDCPNGPAEILQDGRLGKLVPVGDIATLAEALVNLVTQKRLPPDEKDLECYELNWATNSYIKILQG